MKIKRILTNNAVVVVDASNKEEIVCGKGIAYKKRPGDVVDISMVNQVFALANPNMNTKFQQLLLEISLDEVQTADQIIKHAQQTLGITLNDSIYIALSDHIHMAVSRFLDGIVVKNALLWEIKQFYQKEFAIGKDALAIVREQLGVELPEDEAGFIAMHIVNASLKEENQDVHKIIKIVQEITNIVKYFYKIEFDIDSVYYYRFTTHLKFFAQRLILHTTYDGNKDNDLYDIVKEKYAEENECVERIASFINKKYFYTLVNEEKLYLIVHIARLVNRSPSM